MPNGGMHHCGHCPHFERSASRCALRGVRIESSHWTTCRNFGDEAVESGAAVEPAGPLYAIVCEVKGGAGAYGDIPYFDGVRVDTVQSRPGGDTVVRFTDAGGTRHEFASVAEYLSFYEKSGRSF